jgi:hypothetical protein
VGQISSYLQENVLIIFGVVGGVILLVFFICVGRKLKSKIGKQDNQANELVEEQQSSEVNVESAVGSSSI